MTVVATLFEQSIYGYGLTLSIALCLSMILLFALCKKKAFCADAVVTFALFAIPLGVILARLVFCLAHLSAFIDDYQNPWLMLRFFDGGLSMIGVYVAVLLSCYLTARIHRLSFGALMDLVCPSFALFIAIARLGESFTDLGIGFAVKENVLTEWLPALFSVSQMGIATEYRLLVYFYEALACFVLCLITLGLLLKKKPLRQGDCALFFFALYGAFQVVFESMRDDGHMLIIFLRLSQLVAALMPIIVIAILMRRYRRLKSSRILGVAIPWGIVVLFVAGIVLLEFSLDGRITWGTPSTLRDYLLMSGLCLSIFGAVCYLLSATNGSHQKISKRA